MTKTEIKVNVKKDYQHGGIKFQTRVNDPDFTIVVGALSEGVAREIKDEAKRTGKTVKKIIEERYGNLP